MRRWNVLYLRVGKALASLPPDFEQSVRILRIDLSALEFKTQIRSCSPGPE